LALDRTRKPYNLTVSTLCQICIGDSWISNEASIVSTISWSTTQFASISNTFFVSPIFQVQCIFNWYFDIFKYLISRCNFYLIIYSRSVIPWDLFQSVASTNTKGRQKKLNLLNHTMNTRVVNCERCWFQSVFGVTLSTNLTSEKKTACWQCSGCSGASHYPEKVGGKAVSDGTRTLSKQN
jgi:hypothetical protein